MSIVFSLDVAIERGTHNLIRAQFYLIYFLQVQIAEPRVILRTL